LFVLEIKLMGFTDKQWHQVASADFFWKAAYERREWVLFDNPRITTDFRVFLFVLIYLRYWGVCAQKSSTYFRFLICDFWIFGFWVSNFCVYLLQFRFSGGVNGKTEGNGSLLEVWEEISAVRNNKQSHLLFL
jgi:hypothetical protein